MLRRKDLRVIQWPMMRHGPVTEPGVCLTGGDPGLEAPRLAPAEAAARRVTGPARWWPAA